MLPRVIPTVLASILCPVFFCTVLDQMWKKKNPISKLATFGSSKDKQEIMEYNPEGESMDSEKTAVAHFMLGNTYPYTPTDWLSTLTPASETGLDALALNLGPEEWQFSQARSAFRVLEQMDSNRGLKLFLSLDMNVLPSTSTDDLETLVEFVQELSGSSAQLKTKRKHLPGSGIWEEEREGKGRGKIVLSTFGGGEVSFGGKGWEGFMRECKDRGLEVYFVPSFFLPPEKILDMPYVDAAFNWNAAWPMGNHTIQTKEDQPFLKHRKPYMAAVSPWFFTHYGTTGEWAWNKNWIYRSDDNLYAKRWLDILDKEFDPEFVQIVSWNDYGESHYIGPIMGAQPGSERWTDEMPHEAWRKLTGWFIRRYKGVPWTEETETSVYLSYRLQPKDWVVAADEVGKPDRAGFAQDLISVVVTLSGTYDRHQDLFLLLSPGEKQQQKVKLHPKHGIALATVPFPSKEVSFALHMDKRVILEGKGKPILSDVRDATLYNFNAWTGVWSV